MTVERQVTLHLAHPTEITWGQDRSIEEVYEMPIFEAMDRCYFHLVSELSILTRISSIFYWKFVADYLTGPKFQFVSWVERLQAEVTVFDCSTWWAFSLYGYFGRSFVEFRGEDYEKYPDIQACKHQQASLQQ